jgi:sugar phosphate isomerase/epimerase
MYKETGLRDCAKLGVVHHSLYPCKHNPELHLRTLPCVLGREDTEVVDLTVPYGRQRESAIQIIRASGKTIVYNGYLMPTPIIPLGTFSPTERAQLLLLAADQVDVAYRAGAVLFMQSVGADPGEAHRARAFAGLGEYIRRLNDYMKKRGNMSFLIELMDRDVDRKSLCGPTGEVIAFLEDLRRDVPDVGLVLDINHLMLMGEPFEDAFRRCGPYLRHLHLGNCVLGDRSHPMWGGTHPPLGIEGGEVNLPELVTLFRILVDIGYVGAERRGSMTLEITCLPGRTPEETITDNMARLEQAWEALGSS